MVLNREHTDNMAAEAHALMSGTFPMSGMRSSCSHQAAAIAAADARSISSLFSYRYL
ncbi:MAG: hypothetical protein ACOX1O_02880 [Eggerthellaceae bacterium]|jgi:hypothetical protein